MSLREFEESPLVVGAGELWHEATEAAFLSAIRDGNLPREAFQRWLVQDYSFAKGLATFQAIAVARAPRPAQIVLIGGLSALDAELDWFEQNAQQQALDLNSALHPTCRRYVDYLIASAYTQPFEVLLAILYGVEASYLCAWSALEASGTYAEFINNTEENEPRSRYNEKSPAQEIICRKIKTPRNVTSKPRMLPTVVGAARTGARCPC